MQFLQNNPQGVFLPTRGFSETYITIIVTRKTPVQTIGYIKSFDYINFSVTKLYSNYFVHTFILYIISIGE